MKKLSQPVNVTQQRPPSPLGIKDSLRELRMNAKRSAQALAAEVEGAAAQFPAPLGKPIGAVARAATHALEIADRAVVDLLTVDNSFRQGAFRLQLPSSFMATPPEERIPEAFIAQFYQAAKLLIAARDPSGFIIREQAISDAYLEFRAMLLDLESGQQYFEKNRGFPSQSSLISAHLILALIKVKPVAAIHSSKVAENESMKKLADLNLRVSVAVVLASEIADVMQNSCAKTETLDAIALSDEIVSARMDVWEWAVNGRFAHYNIAREIDFMMRHL